MTRDDIIKLAIQVGFGAYHAPQLERFATLVAAAEREACAKMCEEHWEIDGTHTSKEFAEIIRAREQE